MHPCAGVHALNSLLQVFCTQSLGDVTRCIICCHESQRCVRRHWGRFLTDPPTRSTLYSLMIHASQGPYFDEIQLSAYGLELDRREREMMMEGGVESADFLKYVAEDSGNVASDGNFSFQV